MDRFPRRYWPALLAFVPLTLLGCSESMSPPSVGVTPTPAEILDPKAPPAASSKTAPPAAPATKPKEATPAAKAADSAASSRPLVPMSFDKFRADVATNPKAKLTLVDAWATWCGPCKENFPHLVEMHKKYAAKGLAVASLSLDDPTDAKAVAEANRFLQEKGADFPNVLLDEKEGEGFERLDINSIPAVFLYDPSGKEIRRFTGDDADRQFTYPQVEEVVGLLLDGKLLPPDAPGEVYTPRPKEEETKKADAEK